jgi:hypothetical protein
MIRSTTLATTVLTPNFSWTPEISYFHNNVTNLIDCHFNNHKFTQLTPKTASVVPPEDGRLTPETCRGLRHNKVIAKVKVY